MRRAIRLASARSECRGARERGTVRELRTEHRGHANAGPNARRVRAVSRIRQPACVRQPPLRGFGLNIVFDLGGVVVAWRPDEIVARAFADPATQQLVRREIIGHPDWLELDRGTLSWDTAITRGAERTG